MFTIERIHYVHDEDRYIYRGSISHPNTSYVFSQHNHLVKHGWRCTDFNEVKT